jgi:sugar/nucleoside kinase (ribokinase family)
MPSQPTTPPGGASRPAAVGTGLVALDVVVSEISGAPPRFWAGGTCGNVLAALSFLGWSASPIARLRPGDASDKVLADLRACGVSDRFISVTDDGSTPVIVERIRLGGDQRPHHSFTWRCPSCGRHFPPFKPVLAAAAENIAERLEKPQVFFFDRASPGAVILARAASAAGALVVFEPSGIGNPVVFRQAWEVSHVVKYSHERLNDLPEVSLKEEPLLQIETLGECGLRYRRRTSNGRRRDWLESVALPAPALRDTAGAGDWCTAGILARAATEGLTGFQSLTDQALHEALHYGQTLAAWTCGFEGARGGMYATDRRSFARQIARIVRGGKRSVLPLRVESVRQSAAAAAYCFDCRETSDAVRAAGG